MDCSGKSLSVRLYSEGFDDCEVMANEKDSDAEDEGVDGDVSGEAGERVGLPRDDEVVRKV